MIEKMQNKEPKPFFFSIKELLISIFVLQLKFLLIVDLNELIDRFQNSNS